MRRFHVVVCALAAALVFASAAFADDGDEGVAQFRPRPVPNPEPRFAVGVKAGTLGIGVQVGTAVSRRVNLRGGVNMFTYSDSMTESGVKYNYDLKLQSVEAKMDFFVIGGFHVSPGVLMYNDNHVDAIPSVAGGQSFSLGGVSYLSSPASPITGLASVTTTRFAPTLGIGFGNLLPRSNRHWSLSTDLGVAFQDVPKVTLAFAGSACAPNGSNCQPINNIPGVQPQIESERQKIQDDVKILRYYPDVSIMIGYKF